MGIDDDDKQDSNFPMPLTLQIQTELLKQAKDLKPFIDSVSPLFKSPLFKQLNEHAAQMEHKPVNRVDLFKAERESNQRKKELEELQIQLLKQQLAQTKQPEFEPEKSFMTAKCDSPTLKGRVKEIGMEIADTDFISTPSRKKGYLGLIWKKYGDEPDTRTFLKRLNADGFVNELLNPSYDREIAPIYKIHPSKGIWLTFEEDSVSDKPSLGLQAIRNNIREKWIKNSKKKSKQE